MGRHWHPVEAEQYRRSPNRYNGRGAESARAYRCLELSYSTSPLRSSSGQEMDLLPPSGPVPRSGPEVHPVHSRTCAPRPPKSLKNPARQGLEDYLTTRITLSI